MHTKAAKTYVATKHIRETYQKIREQERRYTVLRGRAMKLNMNVEILIHCTNTY